MTNISSSGTGSFIASEEFKRFCRPGRSFNLFKAFGAFKKETVYSRILAYLLDPRSGHGCAEKLFEALWVKVTGEKPVIEGLKSRREDQWIDVVAQSSSHVLAIENKVTAAEGDHQIARYQETLHSSFKERSSLLIFLTPTGRESRTVNLESNVRVEKLSYGDLAKVLNEVAHDENTGQDVSGFLTLCAHHFEEQIMRSGEDKEVARRIWTDQTQAQAVMSILEHRPRVKTIQKAFEERVTNLVVEMYPSTSVKFRRYPKRGTPYELGVHVKRWDDAGLPFEVMLHNKFESHIYPAVHTVVGTNKIDDPKTGLREIEEWSREHAIVAADAIAYHKIRRWPSWQKVWAAESGDSYGRSVREVSTDEAMAEQAIELVGGELERLKKLVEPFLEQSPKAMA